MRSAGHERRQIMIELLLLGVVTVALLVYLVYALLLPERF
jgi:K+-transporting ATPase KdpF subunit